MNNKAKSVVEMARGFLGSPYVFGAWGEPCTATIRKRYAGYNPAHKDNIYKACRILKGKAAKCSGCKYENKRCFDCRGFVYYVFLNAAGIKITGGGATSQYNTKTNWAARGSKSTLPNLVCALYQQNGSKMQHTGIHIGDGQIIHCSSGVQTGKTSDKAWSHWAIPVGMYTDDEIKAAGVVLPQPIVKTLKVGSRGDDVKKIQTDLNALGYSCGAVDGIFGAKTKAAVKSFQKANNLTVDGLAGKFTLAAIQSRIGGESNG